MQAFDIYKKLARRKRSRAAEIFLHIFRPRNCSARDELFQTSLLSENNICFESGLRVKRTPPPNLWRREAFSESAPNAGATLRKLHGWVPAPLFICLFRKNKAASSWHVNIGALSNPDRTMCSCM
jgi:hypothetical protein